MAHTCQNCGQFCTCQGDWDDIDFGEWFGCEHDCDEDDLSDIFIDEDGEEYEYHSLECTCETCIQNHPERQVYLEDEND